MNDYETLKFSQLQYNVHMLCQRVLQDQNSLNNYFWHFCRFWKVLYGEGTSLTGISNEFLKTAGVNLRLWPPCSKAYSLVGLEVFLEKLLNYTCLDYKSMNKPSIQLEKTQITSTHFLKSALTTVKIY